MPKKKTSPQSPIAMAAASGIAWTMVQTFFGKASLFFGQLILARILSPEDFGVLGLAYTIATFFGIFSDMGIGQTLQQRHPRTHLWATQAFWTSLILSTLAAIAMAVCAPIGAQLYHNDKIVALIWILALNMPISALATVPSARIQSQLRFHFMASYGSIEMIATQTLAIIFAWLGFGALSFVLPIPILSLCRLTLYWITAPVPLRPFRLSKGWWLMVKRSTGIFGSSVLTTAIGQGDYITLGLLMPAPIVGVYYFAFKLSAQPMLTLASTFTNVLRPTLVALKSDRPRQCMAALRTAELLGLLIVPLCYLQIAIAKPALILLFGTRWLESVSLIQILSMGLPFSAIAWAAATLLLARGQNAKLFSYQLIAAPFFFTLVGAGALTASSVGVAIGVAIYYASQSLFITTRVFLPEGIGLRKILSLFYIPFLLASLSFGAAYALSLNSAFRSSLMAQISVTTILGGLLYLLTSYFLAPHLWLDVYAKLSRLLKLRSAP